MKTHKKALFICFKKYRGILEGGGVINTRNYVIVQQILGEENVEAFYIHDEANRRSLLNKIYSVALFPLGYFNGMTPQIVKTIVRKAQHFDYVFISTSIFGIVAKRLKESGYKGTIIAHFHNVESVYYESYISKRMPLRDIITHCAYQNDGYCMKYADRILALNQRDYNLLTKMYGSHAHHFIIPISVADKFEFSRVQKPIMTSSRPKCLFIGSSFNANNEGILWFVRNVLPHVNIEFKIVGKGMAKFKSITPELSNIEIVSDVPDLAQYYYEADFLVLPIFAGSGMKVKTCEALMYGKNILGTDESFEGYDIDANKVGGRCNTAAEFISAINRYAETPIPRHNEYARSIYQTKYSDTSIIKLFSEILGF